jgi:hypothetical protein
MNTEIAIAECPECNRKIKVYEGRLCKHGWIGDPVMCGGSGKEVQS